MSSKEKYNKIVKKELHILVTVTGWTHGHIADVIAAVGSGPSPVLVFNWLGWAGPFMCMPEAVHFTIVGEHALSPRQTLEYARYRERLATVDPCYQPAQGPLSHPRLGANRWTRSHFNLPSAEENFIYFFGGAMNRILEATFYMWLGIVYRVVGACLLLLSRPKGMRTRIKKWIANYIANMNPDFDPSRVLFRPFQNKTHFCGMIQAVVENWAGVGLDTVEPIAPHTTANDLHAHGCGMLTYVSEGGFHQRVVFELQLEYGLNGQLVAKSRDEFPELCVRFGRDKSLQRAVGQYLLRRNGERVQGGKLPRQLLEVFERGFDMYTKAGRDYTKLQDFRVTDGPPVQTFHEGPECAALLADVVGPDAAKLQELLNQMRAKGLEERLEAHALKLMDVLQRKGLSLIEVVGVGAFSIAISAVAERSINASVPAGTKVALKVSKQGVPVDHIKNNSLARECVNMISLEKRLERQEWSDVIAAPVYLWDSPVTGRCFWGHTAADEETFCLTFACVELIEGCFADVMRPFGEQWMRQGIIGEGFQDKVLRALFQLLFELRHTAGLSVMDLKGANVGVRANERLAILDLGNAVAWPMLNSSERVTSQLPVALSRNASLAIDGDGRPAKAKGSKLKGSRDASSGLSLVSNGRVSDFCSALYSRNQGWGRVSQAGGTFGYADQKHQGQKLTPEACYSGDMFAGGRCVLKLMTHKRNNHERLEAWDRRACLAAEGGPAGIRKMLEEAVDPDVQITQTINLERLANLLAGLLDPDPDKRMSAKEAMLHAANTLPSFSPEHSLALASARGIVMAGGPVESLAVPFRECPSLKGKKLPPIALLQQADMGMGAKVLCALKEGDVATVYGGEHILRTDTGRLRRAGPSRYGVSVHGVKGIEACICDAQQTPKRPFQWFIDNSNAGPFLNGRDGEGHDINCVLDRHSAWLDGQGGVWFVVKANRDIDEGEWLMWQYNWTAGPGIAIPGLTFAFD
jgi:hypothetical protein